MNANVVPLKVDNMNLADAMGFSAAAGASSKATSDLYRISTAVIQEVEGKKVVDSPVFKLRKDDDTYLARSLDVRFFAERQRWQKWDSNSNSFLRTVMSTNLNMDLKDILGGFNLGRPTGYIKDFKALPADQQDLIRSVSRVKVLMGMARVNGAFIEGGDAVDTFDDMEIPFVYDVKNRESMQAIDGTIAKLMNKRLSPVENLITLIGSGRSMPSGTKFAVVESDLGETVGFADGDNDVLQNFLSYIENSNQYILNKWEENNVERISAEDSAIVGSIVDVQDFE